ncbi:MAG: IS256 family transposase [Eggerthellaceae bacterium]
MAQLNITLDQDEILRLLGDSGGDAFRRLLEASVNAVLRAESDAQLGAARYERTDERTDSRNGTRERPLVTRLGTIELKVPRHRSQPFKTLVFENYKRSEAALVTTMAEMVVAGVSTAKVGRVMEQICGKSFSKQCVSEACAELDGIVAGFRDRVLDGDYLFVMADATYVKVREGHRVRPKALMVALGLTRSGRKEIIGLALEDAETAESWTRFLSSLRRRGLGGMRMLTSDAHKGIIAALQEVYPDVAWQRCQAHLARNVVEKAPKRMQAGLRSELTELFNCGTVELARARRDEIIADYAELAPAAMECLDEGFDDAMTAMELPPDMRRPTRTSNYLERLNREIKRRSKVVGVFPSAASAMRLMGAVLMEENDRWASMGRIYYSPAVEALEEKAEVLVTIAREQRRMKMAA